MVIFSRRRRSDAPYNQSPNNYNYDRGQLITYPAVAAPLPQGPDNSTQRWGTRLSAVQT